MTKLEQLLAELDRWLGTPWHHCGSKAGPPAAVCGKGGDCVHVPAQALMNVGLLPASFQISAYEAFAIWNDSNHSSLAAFFAEMVQQNLVRRVVGDDLQPGDLILFRFASRAHHLGVYKGGTNAMFYHCGGPQGRGSFGLSSMREGYYRGRLTNIYRLTALETP